MGRRRRCRDLPEDDDKLPPIVEKFIGKVNPTDAAILAFGFFLGFQLNARPGITFPVVGYIGLPDFGETIGTRTETVKELKTELRERTALLPQQREAVANCMRDRLKVCEDQLAECRAHCDSLFNPGTPEHFRCLDNCVTDHTRCREEAEATCDGFRQILADNEARIREIKAELAEVEPGLMAFRIGQGLGMAILVFAVTRPGFILGVGQVITGIGEIAPL